MKILSKLFAKPIPVPEPTLAERIAKLDGASADFILGTALGGGEEALRVAAVRRLPDGEALRRLAGLAPADPAAAPRTPELVSAAQARCAELVDAGALDFGACCAGAGEPEALFATAALCRDPSHLTRLLESVTAAEELAHWVLEGPSSRVRQLAAERVTDLAAVRELLRQVRGKDKSVYRILKQKSDAQLAEERRAAELAAEIAGVLASLERHAARSFDAQYASTIDYLEKRWRALAPAADAASNALAEAAIDRSREVVARHLREVAQLAVAREAEAAAAQAAREARELADHAAQAAAAAAAAEQQRRLEQAELERAAAAAARATAAVERERQERQLAGLVRRAQKALAAGNTREAAGLRRAIESHPLAPGIAQPLRQLDLQLTELKQWKDFAVAPKRLELIEAMESLIGSTEAPRALGDRIKALQDEWRTLSQGISSETPEEWARFHRASQAAYQPCLAYAQAQSQLRRENLDKRIALLERVQQFESSLDDAALDGRTLQTVLREAPREWRSAFPVDRDGNAAVQAGFDAAMTRLQGRLDAWHAQHVADKQALIERARHLQSESDGPEAVEAIKRLQALWKQTGPAPRDRDQVLWKEFRALCDAVFQRREQAYADHAAQQATALRTALELCERAEALAAAAPADSTEAVGRIAELRTAFAALEELPRAEGRAIPARFARALAGAQARVEEARRQQVQRALADLFDAGQHVHAYDWAVASGSDPVRCAELRAAAAAFIGAVPRWPAGGLAVLNERLAGIERRAAGAAAGRDGLDAAARERALRLICIRCEIEAGMTSPEQDQGLRREHQVQRLMQGMGQGVMRAESAATVLEWIRTPAAEPAVLETLRARLWRCLATR